MPDYRPTLLLIAAISFGLGISLPLIRLEKFFFLTESPSLLQLVFGLWRHNDMGLAALVGAFCLVFPVIKLVTMFEAAYGARTVPAWTGLLAKWSMMDVLLVAIFVFAAKTSGLAAAASQPGIWFYALSTVAAAVAAAGLGQER